MGNTTKNLTRIDGNQVLQASFNVEDSTMLVNGFIVGAVGRKIEVASGGTTDTFTFSENGVTLYVLLLTYTDVTKATLLSAERTA